MAVHLAGAMQGFGSERQSVCRTLNRLCVADGICLVNVVGSNTRVSMLREAGATHVCNTNLDGFTSDLQSASQATGAALAFDAVGGGKMLGRMLAAIEAAVGAQDGGYQRYGSATFTPGLHPRRV